MAWMWMKPKQYNKELCAGESSLNEIACLYKPHSTCEIISAHVPVHDLHDQCMALFYIRVWTKWS